VKGVKMDRPKRRVELNVRWLTSGRKQKKAIKKKNKSTVPSSGRSEMVDQRKKDAEQRSPNAKK